jgi:acyl carrier protein
VQEAEDLENDIKELIIEALLLEDTTPEEIETDAQLFIEGLGLDSIDALELVIVLERRYGVTLREDPDEIRKIFESVKTLCEFVSQNRTK